MIRHSTSSLLIRYSIACAIVGASPLAISQEQPKAAQARAIAPAVVRPAAPSPSHLAQVPGTRVVARPTVAKSLPAPTQWWWSRMYNYFWPAAPANPAPVAKPQSSSPKVAPEAAGPVVPARPVVVAKLPSPPPQPPPPPEPVPAVECGKVGKSYFVLADQKKVPYRFATKKVCGLFLDIFGKAPLFPKAMAVLAGQKSLNIKPTGLETSAADAKIGFETWRPCGVAGYAYHLAKNVGGYLVKPCEPDTLYSWGNLVKLKWFMDNLKDGEEWTTLPRALFTTESAAATFPYGQFPIRFKIKPDVKFRIVGEAQYSCPLIRAGGYMAGSPPSTTIYQRVVVRDGGTSFMDFILCSANPISSWSYGTRDHYEEIYRDFSWMSSHNYKDWEGYSKQNGVDDLITKLDISAEYHTASEATVAAFQIRMAMLKALAAANDGVIVGQKGEDKATHTLTRFPIYFNPF